jgi:hypothetical protein
MPRRDRRERSIVLRHGHCVDEPDTGRGLDRERFAILSTSPVRQGGRMSALSSVTSSASYPLLQQLQQRNAPGSFNRADFQAQRTAEFGSALQAAGVDSSKIDDIQKQIQDAVQGARQNGAAGTDNRAATKAAVEDVLKNNGVDVAKFEQSLKASHAKHGGRAGGPPPGDAGASKSSETESTDQTATLSSKLAELLKSLANGTSNQSQTDAIPAGSLVDVSA